MKRKISMGKGNLKMTKSHAKCLFRQASSLSTEKLNWLERMGFLQPRSIK